MATEVQEITVNFPDEAASGKLPLDVNSRVNTERIQNVENCFGSSGQPLRENGRVLVGEGVLTKMCRKKPKPRQVFLFNDILVYGNILIPKKKYIKQNIIPLERVSLENIEDTSDMKNGWVIRTPTKSFVVYAASKTEKQQWMSHISTCITELLKKTGMNPSKEHAAVWVPDSDAGKCMVCKETKFTLLNRRHHCRKCGCVVCANCSQHKFLLPTQSTKPVRVCDCCYHSLSMGKGEVDVSSEEVSPSEPPVEKVESKDLRDADTTDDSEDDEEPDETEDSQPPAEIKEEKPTFYPADSNANKQSEESVKDTSTEDAVEKMDDMKITPKETITKTDD